MRDDLIDAGIVIERQMLLLLLRIVVALIVVVAAVPLSTFLVLNRTASSRTTSVFLYNIKYYRHQFVL